MSLSVLKSLRIDEGLRGGVGGDVVSSPGQVTWEEFLSQLNRDANTGLTLVPNSEGTAYCLAYIRNGLQRFSKVYVNKRLLPLLAGKDTYKELKRHWNNVWITKYENTGDAVHLAVEMAYTQNLVEQPASEADYA